MLTLIYIWTIFTLTTPQESILDNFKTEFANSNLYADYELSNFIKPQYLISDFNGDKEKDIAILVVNKKNKKRGFIIYHSKTKSFFTIGAGVTYNMEDKWDDIDWVDHWKINTKKINKPGIQGGKDLKINFDSIEIIKLDTGGGLIYWTGKKYAYFHQTC